MSTTSGKIYLGDKLIVEQQEVPDAPGTLQTDLTTAQSVSASEALSGSIKLHKIAKTGTYSDLIGTPTIPTKVSELTNDAGYTTNTGTVTRVDVGTSQYSPTSGVVSLPAYPTTLPASDVSAWAKAANKPSYTFSEIGSTPTSLGGYGITDWLVKSTTDSLDSLTTAGVYKLSSQATPYGGYGNLFVIHGAGDTLAQMYFPYDADAVFFRRGTTSNFTSNTWQHLYHSGNSNKDDVPWACKTLAVGSNGSGWSATIASTNSRVYLGHAGGYAIYAGTKLDDTSGYLLDLRYGQTTLGVAGSCALYVRSDGNVGIGTNVPTQTVHVVGNILATGTITPGSDSRIKSNQKEITTEDAFFIIENLQPKTWVWNEKADKRLKDKSAAGLVAQDVKEILPDAVTISENGDIKDFHSLNYNTIHGYEIAAIKGLIEEIKSLKAEIAELKKNK